MKWLRLKTLENVLAEEAIPMEALREIASHGIPDEGSLRPLCWRVLSCFDTFDYCSLS